MNKVCKLIILVVSILIFGCDISTRDALDKAESLIQEHPKDALLLLDSLKSIQIKGNMANARFALLYSMALDKNYIDITDDSLISIAENWYIKKGNIREKFLSHYYKGVVNGNAKKYPEAITAFSQAQKYETSLGDNYLLGLLYNQMGYIYKNHFDYGRCLNAFQQAYNFYDMAGKINHKNYMLMNIADAYWNMENYPEAEHYYKEALSEGERTNYNILVELSVIGLIGQYVERKMYDEAIELNKKYIIKHTPSRTKFLGNLARLYHLTGESSLGDEILDKAWKYSKSVEDSLVLYMHEYYISRNRGNIESSLEALEESQKLQNKAVSLKLQQPVLQVQKELLEKDLEYANYRHDAERKIAVLVYIMIGLLVFMLLLYVRVRLKKKEEQIANYAGILSELQSSLELVSNKSNNVIADRLEMINNLSVLLYEKSTSPKAKEIFIREVRSIIDNFISSDDYLHWMEQIINASNNNLLQNIYDKFPALRSDERRLLCYIYAGFSPKSISVFLNIPVETVYNRKYRLLLKTGLSKAKNRKVLS